MIIYAHKDLTDSRRGSRRGPALSIAAGTWIEVRNDVGRRLLRLDHVCDVSGMPDPEGHLCGYTDTQMTPPMNTNMNEGSVLVQTPVRMSPQRRKLMRQAWGRSRRARIETRQV